MISLESYLAMCYKAKEKIHLTYIKPGGGQGHCYIDPTVPHRYRIPNKDGSRDNWAWPHPIDNLLAVRDSLKNNTGIEPKDYLYSFHKCNTHAEIFVCLRDVSFQNSKKGRIMEILYGI